MFDRACRMHVPTSGVLLRSIFKATVILAGEFDSGGSYLQIFFCIEISRVLSILATPRETAHIFYSSLCL